METDRVTPVSPLRGSGNLTGPASKQQAVESQSIALPLWIGRSTGDFGLYLGLHLTARLARLT